jgi:alpha-tubulin suppressor-like RCC1 family protein
MSSAPFVDRYRWVLLVLCLALVARAAAAEPAHAYGARAMTAEERAYLADKIFTVQRTKAPLPASVRNTAYLPVVGDQGWMGSCSAFAACYYLKTYQEARENGWLHPDPAVNPERVASPAYCFITNLRIPTAALSSGINYWMAAQTMVDFGVGSWAEMPYDMALDVNAWPDEATWRRAISWRARQAGAVRELHTPAGLDTLKEHLAGGDVAVISFTIISSFDEYPSGDGSDNGVYYRDVGLVRVGHAVCVVGYDDSKAYTDARTGTPRQGAFLIVNSWGSRWGVHEPSASPDTASRGFGWMAYDYFLAGKVDREAMVLVDRIGYTPTRLAYVGINHPTGRVLDLELRGGDREQPQWRRRALPRANAGPLNQRFPVDLTELAATDPLTYWLRVTDPTGAGEWLDTGTVTDFAVETVGQAPLVSSDVPLQTVKDWGQYLRLGVFSESGLDLAGLHIREGSAAWGDYDGDGFPDLALTGLDFPAAGASAVAATRLLRNLNGTAFVDSGAVLLPTRRGTVAWGELDNDGRLDLLVSDPTAGTRIYRNTGTGFVDSGVALPGSVRTGAAWGDVDNDGRQDLAIATDSAVRLYRNTGTGFEPLEQILAGPYEAALSWGDANGDGYLDLLVVSRSEFFAPFTRLYLNRGDDTFVAADSGLPALQQGTAAWGDVDADGRLDLALQGTDGNARTGIYRSLGTGGFTPEGSPLPGLQAGALQWGDIDNDGHLDLLLSGRERDVYGQSADYPNRALLFRATPEGFVDGQADLQDVSNGFAGLADLDRDGDLDVLLGGTTGAILGDTPAQLYNGIYSSAVSHPSALARANTPPQPPSGLSAVAADPGAVRLTWNDGSDAETPANGLRYHVRVGSTAGAGDVLSGALPVGPFGLLRRSGLPVRRLSPGTYHWAVRSVDNGFAVSAWSAAASFTVGTHTPLRQLTLAAVPSTWGTTTPTPGLHTYLRDTAAPISAVASPGYRFSAWQGAVANATAATTSVLLHDNRVVTAAFAVKYDASPVWTQQTPSAPWAQRYMHQAVAFHDQLWVLGGTGQPHRHDVWSSSNGQAWTQQTAAAAWSGRYGHAAVVFKDRLWVLGGYDVSARNDVWSSADGITWRLETGTAAWPERMLHSVVVFNDQLWLLGGYGSGTGALSDVWSSSDGIAWTQVSTAAWPARHSHGALAFGGKLWVLGGSSAMVQPTHDVWSSADGATWTQVTEHAEWGPRSLLGVAVLADRMWVLGGAGEEGMGTDDVWFSSNGATWTRAGTASGWSPRQGQAVAVLNNRLWVLGGNSAALCSDVWSGLPGTSVAGLATLFVNVDPADAGTTTPSVGEHVEAVGTVFPVSATARPGFRFVGWTGPVAAPSAATTTVTLSAERTVTARFEVVPVPMTTLLISVSPADAGSTTPATGSATYPVGSVVTVTATPAHGYLFTGWTGAVADPSAPVTTVTLDSAKAITAGFAADGFVRAMPLAAGSEYSVVLKTEGSAWSWGRNDFGQLGNGRTADVAAPYPLSILGEVTALASGERHTLALRRNGTVQAWGCNDEGQLGDGSVQTRTTPGPVVGLPPIVAIACGAAHSLALAADGTVWTWGRNTDGTLGCGLDPRGYGYVMTPERLPGPYGVSVLRGITEIAAGGDHALALRADGTVYAWGRNTWGQLGTGSCDPSDFPTAVPGLADVRLIACGGDTIYGGHSLAVDASGTLWAWGANRSGQLGDGTTGERSSPVAIPAEGDVIGIAAGGCFSLALRSDGTLCAWGDNAYGQLGDGTRDNRAVPAPLSGLPRVTGLAAGAQHALVVLADGSLRAWGRNTAGMLGDGTLTDRLAPVAVAGINLQVASRGLTLASEPAASGTLDPLPGTYRCLEDAAVPLLATGNARYAFAHWTGTVTVVDAAQTTALMGADQTVTAHFELRPGVQALLTVAAAPAAGGATTPPVGIHSVDQGSVVSLSARAGYRHRFTSWTGSVADAAAMDTSTTVLADQTVTANFAPLPFATSASLRAGGLHTFLIRSDGTVLGAGDNTAGELGRPVGDVRWPGPVAGPAGNGLLTGIVDLAVGTYHTVALRYDGSVWTWGSNRWGQLGDGQEVATHSSQPTPAPVLNADGSGPLRGIRAVRAGRDFNLALADDGTIWAWGDNRAGQLGDATTNPRCLPARVRGLDSVGDLTDVVDITCGPQHALARRADGSWWGWGSNADSALATAELTGSLTPVPMAIPSGIVQIACGLRHTLARRSDGSLLAWGWNAFGEMGEGVALNTLSPTPIVVSGISAIAMVAAGQGFSVALRTDGSVWTWGWNREGYLGNNSADPSSQPVQVWGPDGSGLLADIVAVACGSIHAAALRRDGKVFTWGSNQRYELGTLGVLMALVPTAAVMDSATVAVATRVLRLSASPAAGGTTLPDASSHTYDLGDVVDLEARPTAGWRFVTWTGSAASRAAARTTLTVTADEAVTAHFERDLAELGDVNRDGTVNPTDAALCLAMAVRRDVVLAGLTRAHPYPAAYRETADMNADGQITAADAEAVMRRALGVEGPVPDPYVLRAPAPPETHPEEVVGYSVPGEAATVTLSDGTAVEIPALSSAAEIRLARQTNTTSLADYGLQASGSRRTLTLTFADGISDADRWQLRPVITIPYAETGGLTADTVNIARVSQRLVDGEWVQRVFFLPVFRDRDGNLMTCDPHAAGDVAPLTGGTGKGDSRAPLRLSFDYFPGTFQGVIDWSVPARLVRMAPLPSLSYKRRPLSAMLPADQAVEMTKAVQNVVVLVHGHNEGEQAGLPGTFVADDLEPWTMGYKRQVWDYIYKVFLEDHPELLRCTVFYEFIYPSWRTVFGHLDQAFMTSLENALRPQLDPDLKLNLFVVAHSMGGLVSRAGLQLLPEALDPQFRQLVTWGSPHHGAMMSSFRYAMCSPYYDLNFLPNWLHWLIARYFETKLVLDTPGARDLRWSNGPLNDPRYTNIGGYFFTYRPARITWDYGLTFPGAELNMRTGTHIYNPNLRLLNAADTKRDRLTCLYGVTESGLRRDMFGGSFMETASSVTGMEDYGEIALGASINLVLTENGFTNQIDGVLECRSDGASPLISEIGLGLTDKRVNLGNIDHEEYYSLEGKARYTAARTFEALGIGTNPAYNAPSVTFTRPAANQPLVADEDGSFTLDAKLTWPGDPYPGRRVKNQRVDLIVYDRLTDIETSRVGGRSIPWQDMIVADSGQLSGSFVLPPEAAGAYAAQIIYHFKDDTEAHGMIALASRTQFETVRNGTTLSWNVTGVTNVRFMQNQSTPVIVIGEEPGAMSYGTWYTAIFPPESAAATVTVTVTVDPTSTPGLHRLRGNLFGGPTLEVTAVVDPTVDPPRPLTLTFSGLCTEAGVQAGGFLVSYMIRTGSNGLFNRSIVNGVSLSGWRPDPSLESRLPAYYNPNLGVTP